MEPHRGEPLPSMEVGPDVKAESGSEIIEKNVEVPARPESSAVKPSQPAIINTDDIALAASSTQIPGDDAQSAMATAPPTTKNNDRIERQWVDRAKAVVEQTQNDPYKQKNEMSKVKAEYIKQRFNKIIKTDAEAA